MKTLITFILLFFANLASANPEVGCVVTLRSEQQLLMNDLKPAAATGQKIRLKGQIGDYNFLVTVSENRSVARVNMKAPAFALTTYAPLNTVSSRPRLLFTVPEGFLELRCRRWTL